MLTHNPDGNWTNSGTTHIHQSTTVQLTDTTLTNNGVIDVDGKGTLLDIEDTSFVLGDNGVINNGTIHVNDAAIRFSTIVGGPGKIDVTNHGTVYLRSQTSSGTVNLSGNSTVEFGGSNEFFAEITHMSIGSMIKLDGAAVLSDIVTHPTANTSQLTVFPTPIHAGGELTALFAGGNLTAADFGLTNAGGNGFITLLHH